MITIALLCFLCESADSEGEFDPIVEALGAAAIFKRNACYDPYSRHFF